MTMQKNLNLKPKAIAILSLFLYCVGCSIGFFVQFLIKNGYEIPLVIPFLKYANIVFIAAAGILGLIAVSAMFAMNKKAAKILNYSLIPIALLTPFLFCMGISICFTENGLLAWLAGFCCFNAGPIGAAAVLLFLMRNIKCFEKPVFWLTLPLLFALFLVNIFCFFPIYRYAVSHSSLLNSLFQFAVRLCGLIVSWIGL
ncbi:MAG: hypothetical protein IJG60_04920 [Thermoguttaceae bacterium]|nr:hypothetical protein [Thermoguttaceae bacterium]